MTIVSLKEFGANIDEGLERCMGMEDFYIEMIELGMSDERFELLGKNLEAKDLEEAFETVHALKGVIGNLALKPIYEPLAEMTELLRARKLVDYISMYRPIKEIRDRLLALTQD